MKKNLYILFVFCMCCFMIFSGCNQRVIIPMNNAISISKGTFLFGKCIVSKDFDVNDKLYISCNNETGRDLLVFENGKLKSAGLAARLSNHRILGDAVYMIDNGEFGANLQGLVRYDLSTHKKDVVIKTYYCTRFEPIQGKLLINVAPEKMGIPEEKITVPSGLYLYEPETNTMELLFENINCIGISICGDYAYLEYYQDEAKYLAVFDTNTNELKNIYQYDKSLTLPYSWCPNDEDSFYLMTEKDISLIYFNGTEELLYQGTLPVADEIVKGDGALYFTSHTVHLEREDFIYSYHLERFDLSLRTIEMIQSDLEKGFLCQWGNQLMYIPDSVSTCQD